MLTNYVKPINFLTEEKLSIKELDSRVNYELIDMLFMICRYLNQCCQMDSNCIVVILNTHKNFVFDLIECLDINDSLHKGKSSNDL